MSNTSREPVAVVTGAASGIGAAVAMRLAADDYTVWLADKNGAAAEVQADSITSLGGSAYSIALDVTDSQNVRAAFQAISGHGPVDALINSAAVGALCAFEDATAGMWEDTYRVNVVGTYLCIQAALPALRAAPPPARIVNVASTAGKLPGPFIAPYSASKAAMINLTRSAAAALAPGIRVNCVCPGPIDTPMLSEARAKAAAVGDDIAEAYQERLTSLPIGRIGAPVEVANVIAFLVSKESSFVLGSDVNVNGGLAMF